jgi:hypothetical protein
LHLQHELLAALFQQRQIGLDRGEIVTPRLGLQEFPGITFLHAAEVLEDMLRPDGSAADKNIMAGMPFCVGRNAVGREAANVNSNQCRREKKLPQFHPVHPPGVLEKVFFTHVVFRGSLDQTTKNTKFTKGSLGSFMADLQ